MSERNSTHSPTSGSVSPDSEGFHDLTEDLDLGFDGAEDILRAWRRGMRPDPDLIVPEWADQHRWLSSRASAEPGRYRTARTPYLREIMDALSPRHPAQRISFMKAAQVGATEAGNNWIGFVIHHAPGPMLAVLPTVEMAKRSSRGRIDPLIADSPALRERVNPARSRDAGNSMLSKDSRAVCVRRRTCCGNPGPRTPHRRRRHDPFVIPGVAVLCRQGSLTMPAMNWRARLGAWVGGFGIPGGFDATSGQRRLKGFVTTRAHINALIAASGPEMNARARWLVRNNGYAANAIESWAANTVGDGISPNSSITDDARKDAVQKLWLAWTDDADAEGLTDLYGLQRRAAREVFMTGEVFLRFRPRRLEDGLSVPLQIQMLPSEMLPLAHNAVEVNGNLIRQGIEFDLIGRRVAYHFLRRHPGDSTDPGLSGETVRVPAPEVLHIIDPVEAGQLRGVSRLAPAIVKLFLLDQYDDAELDRKKVAAMYAMLVTSPAPDNPLAPPEEEYEVAPGQVVRLDPGEDVTVSAPADSGATYEPFQYRTLLQISAALGIPYGYLTNDGANAGCPLRGCPDLPEHDHFLGCDRERRDCCRGVHPWPRHGATTSGVTKAVNIGTAGLSGSTTNVTIGSAVAGALGTLTINSPTVTFGSTVSAIAMAAANVSALYLGLGGATADASNRLSINAPASLFNHAGAGHQVKLNKAAATDTGSFLFQTGFSGRAEFGLAGSDDFQIKVSSDVSTWNPALAIEVATGRTTVNGLALAAVGADPVLPPNGALWYNSPSGKFRVRQAGVSVDLVAGAAATAAYGVLQANYTLTSVTTAQKLFNWSTNGALSLAAGTYRFSCSLLLTSMSTTSGSAKFDLKGAGSALFGKMSMQDFGSRGTVAVGGTTATSGTASDVPASGGSLASNGTTAALRASIHGTFEITTGGTIIPSIALDVAAAAVVNADSYFECTYLGPTAALGGSWS